MNGAKKSEIKNESLRDRLKKLNDSAIETLEELLNFGPPHVQIKAANQIIELNRYLEEMTQDDDEESSIVIYLPEKSKDD